MLHIRQTRVIFLCERYCIRTSTVITIATLNSMGASIKPDVTYLNSMGLSMHKVSVTCHVPLPEKILRWISGRRMLKWLPSQYPLILDIC